MSEKLPELLCKPIGFIRTGRITKFDLPHQSAGGAAERNRIELLPGHGFEHALRDLAGFEYVWLLYWFHKNQHWKPRVIPPRGPQVKRGVFATRSPHRPNPIGLTACRLLDVGAGEITVGDCDLLEGTPILDIKPYLPRVDAYPQAAAGWVDALEKHLEAPPAFLVTTVEPATAQLEWLNQTWGIDLLRRAREILERDPRPHRTRRITAYKDHYRICCGAWRLFFRVDENQVVIESVTTGYPLRYLENPTVPSVPHREAQQAFISAWPPC